MVTKVHRYRLQVLGYRVQVQGRCQSQVPGRQVSGARQTGRRCQADRSQVPGRQAAGAGQTGCKCWVGAGQVLGRCRAGAGHTGLEVQGISPISPGY